MRQREEQHVHIRLWSFAAPVTGSNRRSVAAIVVARQEESVHDEFQKEAFRERLSLDAS
jgi:DNA-binding IclR family transcriptional regulator